jgi:TRAP-type mannitol/chloroaromatic compound transport system substrate-binding protein
MKKGCVLLSLTVCTCLLLTVTNEALSQDVINWRLQSYFATPSSTNFMNRFTENVKQRTNGKLLIKGYTANQLVNVMGTLDAVSKGAIEMGWGTGIYHQKKVPEAGIEFGLPFTWETWEEQKEVFYKYGLLKMVREAYADIGIYYLSPHPAGPYLLMTKKRIDSIADVKGMKVRVEGLAANVLDMCGASTVAIPGVEQYMALQRGTIDGTVYVTLALTALKLNEVVSYVYYPGFIKPTTDIFVNLNAWKSLSPDLQKALQESIDVMLDDMDKGYTQDDAMGLLTSLISGKLKGALRFPDEDVHKLRALGLRAADDLAAKSPRCKEMVEIVRKFMQDKGKI